MSASLLLALAARAADTATSPQPTLFEPASDTVFRTLCCHIFAYMPLETLGLVVLQVNKAWCHAARQRLALLLPSLRPLMAAPFHLTATELLVGKGPFYFHDCFDDDDDAEGGISAFAEACTSGALSRLEWLGFGFNQTRDAGMSTFAEACARGALPRLEGLNLGRNQIGNDGLFSFSHALRSNALPQLKELYLHKNRISDAGISFFADACTSSEILPQLRELYLWDNHIGDVGILALAQACTSGLLLLEELDISHNQISDAGLSSLSSAIAAGALASLIYLHAFLDDPHDDPPPGVGHLALRAICEVRGVAIA
jgi:hypothetical protein